IDIIKGGVARDNRGQIRFVNDFDMSEVKRFYIIKNADTKFVRGWRAHRIEQRWFYVLTGAFEFNIIKIDDWQRPSIDLPIEKMTISAEDMEIFHVPEGYGTAIKAIEANSELLVFADYGIDHANQDDYTWSLD